MYLHSLPNRTNSCWRSRREIRLYCGLCILNRLFSGHADTPNYPELHSTTQAFASGSRNARGAIGWHNQQEGYRALMYIIIWYSTLGYLLQSFCVYSSCLCTIAHVDKFLYCNHTIIRYETGDLLP